LAVEGALQYQIEPLCAADFAQFFSYLNDHLADNGSPDTGYFQPLPRGQSQLPAEREVAFRNGMAATVGEPGWRRIWVARSAGRRFAGRQIAGHIDLRAHPEAFAGHRCLLGMGVDRRHRRAGLGSALIAHARDWATTVARLEWIDLQVIGANRAALALYGRTGFVVAGETKEMFRIDGQAFSYITMNLRLNAGN
jgi:GNAT superfamily N-acetyltransferase